MVPDIKDYGVKSTTDANLRGKKEEKTTYFPSNTCALCFELTSNINKTVLHEAKERL